MAPKVSRTPDRNLPRKRRTRGLLAGRKGPARARAASRCARRARRRRRRRLRGLTRIQGGGACEASRSPSRPLSRPLSRSRSPSRPLSRSRGRPDIFPNVSPIAGFAGVSEYSKTLNQGADERSVPYATVQNRTVSPQYLTVPYSTVQLIDAYRTVPYRTIMCCVLFRTVPYVTLRPLTGYRRPYEDSG